MTQNAAGEVKDQTIQDLNTNKKMQNSFSQQLKIQHFKEINIIKYKLYKKALATM